MEQTQLLDIKRNDRTGFDHDFTAMLLAKLKELKSKNKIYSGTQRTPIADVVIHYLSGQLPSNLGDPANNHQIDLLVDLAEEFLGIFDGDEKKAAQTPISVHDLTQAPKKIELSQLAKEAIRSNLGELIASAPESIRTRMRGALEALRVENIADLLWYTKKEIFKFRNFGSLCRKTLSEFYASKGINPEVMVLPMKAYFLKLGGLQYNDVPGLTESDEFKRLLELLDETAAGDLPMTNVGILPDVHQNHLRAHLTDQNFQVIVESLYITIQSRVVSYLDTVLAEYLDAL